MTSRSTKLILIAALTLAMSMFGCKSLRDHLSGNDTSNTSMASSSDINGTPQNAGSNTGATGTGNMTNNTNNDMNPPATTASTSLNNTSSTAAAMSDTTTNTSMASSSSTTTETGNEGVHPKHHRAMHKE
jgi:hypothetical protein